MFLGLDFGTSGARACVIDNEKTIVWEQRVAYPDPAALRLSKPRPTGVLRYTRC